MKKIILFLFSLLFSCFLQAKPVELIVWHAMAGRSGDEFKLLTDAFNRSQNKYWVKLVYKGDYTETLTSFAAAFRAHRPPDLVQVFEVGTALMRSPPGVIKPVEELMAEQHLSVPKEDFIPSIREFYSQNGQLMALPFNLSVPILYYNKDVLAKVGYNQANFPRTWMEMDHLAKRLKKAGYSCVYTTAYPGWVLFESFLAIHGLPLIQNNPLRAVFDTPQLAHHFKRLKRWHSLHYFHYAGRVDDGTILFTSGTCPLFSQSSGNYNGLASLVPFHLGIASMPLDTDISKIRHANVAGGAALWAVAGQTEEHYRGIAEFFVFITQPQTQKQWHEHTGYLPLGLTGIYEGISRNSHHPILLIAGTDLIGEIKEPTQSHYGPQNQIRRINDEVLEAMFSGLISPTEALKESVLRINHILLRFSRNTQYSTLIKNPDRSEGSP